MYEGRQRETQDVVVCTCCQGFLAREEIINIKRNVNRKHL